MIAQGSGGIINVASTIAFQPAPSQAVYGACKAFVLSFSEALWAEARTAGVAVTALCPGPTRTGFVDALGADVGQTAIYRRLAEPGPVIYAALRALDEGRAVVIPGLRNNLMAVGDRFMPRKWLTLLTGRLLGAGGAKPRPPLWQLSPPRAFAIAMLIRSARSNSVVENTMTVGAGTKERIR